MSEVDAEVEVVVEEVVVGGHVVEHVVEQVVEQEEVVVVQEMVGEAGVHSLPRKQSSNRCPKGLFIYMYPIVVQCIFFVSIELSLLIKAF